MLKRNILLVLVCGLLFTSSHAQDAEQLLRSVRAKLDKVNDYEARGKMKTNVVFIKAPVASVKVFFKKPDKHLARPINPFPTHHLFKNPSKFLLKIN